MHHNPKLEQIENPIAFYVKRTSFLKNEINCEEKKMKFWKEAGAEIYFQECENKIKKYKQEMEETITKLEIEREKLQT